MSVETATDAPVSIPRPRWVISDTHFYHETILEYCPWRSTWARSLEEHNRALIAAWNSCVQSEDIVLRLGYFCLGQRSMIANIRNQLSGRIVLVRGNHDRSKKIMSDAGFDQV